MGQTQLGLVDGEVRQKVRLERELDQTRLGLVDGEVRQKELGWKERERELCQTCPADGWREGESCVRHVLLMAGERESCVRQVLLMAVQ